jgi:hypothetical protein
MSEIVFVFVFFVPAAIMHKQEEARSLRVLVPVSFLSSLSQSKKATRLAACRDDYFGGFFFARTVGNTTYNSTS